MLTTIQWTQVFPSRGRASGSSMMMAKCVVPSYAFVEQPQTNGVAERFNRTLKGGRIRDRYLRAFIVTVMIVTGAVRVQDTVLDG